MGKQKEVLRVLLKHYTKIGLNGGIAKVIFDDDFEDIAEEIVKLFAIPDSEQLVCSFKTEPQLSEASKK
jgi:hypothetical protein